MAASKFNSRRSIALLIEAMCKSLSYELRVKAVVRAFSVVLLTKLRSSPCKNKVPMRFCFKEDAIAPSLQQWIQPPFKNCCHVCGMKIIRKFLADESGATAIEYGLIAAGIALAIISAVQGVGTKLSANFGKISTSLK